MSGTLSIVATPIGNLEDITLRALRILKECDLILCEDTRVTKKLLQKYEVGTPTMSFHAHSGEAKYAKIINFLADGKHLALVTDAGTPGISDPGGELVASVREQLPRVKIEAIPGPSALASALSVSGLRAQEFTFYGFLPHKKGRETLLKKIAGDERASVFYESTHRIMKALEGLRTLLHEGRRVAVCREMTKTFEETVVGTPAEVMETLSSDPNRTRGEFVVIVEGL